MGKTTLAEVAVLRAVLYGLRRFVVLICATGPLAKRRLKSILRELETNDLLAADFPEACYAIRALERIHNRTAGQTLDGVPTRIEMTAESVILPTVPGRASSGAVIQVGSMEGAIRGLNVAGPDGEQLRPDMVSSTTCRPGSAKQPRPDRRARGDRHRRRPGPGRARDGNRGRHALHGHLPRRPVRPLPLRRAAPRVAGRPHQDAGGVPRADGPLGRVRRGPAESFRAGDEGRRANDFYAANRVEMDGGGG
jgi:hypothetical protein